MPSPEFIESALIFNLNTEGNLHNFKHVKSDFAKHGQAFEWLVNYFDKHGEFPSQVVMQQQFPSLDEKAGDTNFDYAYEQFKRSLLQRNVLRAVNSNSNLIFDDPKKALSNIMTGLTEIETVYDEDVAPYDSGELTRLEEWKNRKQRRKLGDGLMGIPTSFESLNSRGVGWMPGELIAAFARPTIGKTWLCVHAAATAVKAGHRTLLISTEMPSRAINMRIDVVLANLMGYENFSHMALRHGDPIDEEAYRTFLEESNQKDLLVSDHIAGQMGFSLESIASLVRKHKPEFVVIDGVYLISAGDSKAAAWEQSHRLFYGLKNLANAINTPILVTTQANREASDMFTPPKPNHVAFGDALIRAADVALAMCGVEEEDDKRLVQFQKYRDGELPQNVTYMQWGVNNGNIKELIGYAPAFLMAE
jgi:replicative DNA helicase